MAGGVGCDRMNTGVGTMAGSRKPTEDVAPPASPVKVIAAGLTVGIVDATGRLKPADQAWVEEMTVKAAGVLGVSGSVAARVLADADMAEAHNEFCGVPGTTDVITFDLTDPEDGCAAKKVVEADLLLCLDEAERQGKTRGHDARRELLLYIVHGVLHCLGHDDHDGEDGPQYRKMHAEEDRVMNALGIGATFAVEPKTPPTPAGAVKGGKP